MNIHDLSEGSVIFIDHLLLVMSSWYNLYWSNVLEMGMPCTGLMCVLTFFLELSLHKQQAVFTADLYIAFCGGK